MEKEKKAVNIYLLKNDYTKDGKPRKGGQFYNVYKAEGDLGDVTDLSALTDDIFELEEQFKNIDPSFKRIGGIILTKNDHIKNVSMFGSEINYKMESQEASRKKARAIEKMKLLNEKSLLLEELKRNDERLDKLFEEEQEEEIRPFIKSLIK